mmetsp:Transcript_16587/g.18921  ORF Transcript_16587/g.18921 Transcript_16587/m.18921 type:complete len:375 (+) Transcript_16587:144-1268(+)
MIYCTELLINAQRRRNQVAPVDLDLINQPVMTNTTGISLARLSEPDIEFEMNMNRIHCDVQIMRIITPQPNQSAHTRYRSTPGTQQVRFNRIILCRAVQEQSTLVYLMITNNTNYRLFHRDLILRDNGVICIGSFLRILCPFPITRSMQNIPLLTTDYSAIALQTPTVYPTIGINTETNESFAGIWNGSMLRITRTTPISTTCSSHLCDKQRPRDWTFSNRGCGCYTITGLGGSNLALDNTVVVTNNTRRITMNSFSSSKFNDTFLNGPIPANTDYSTLTHNERLNDAIQNCIELINENDGFTVVFWYNRGEMNDQSLIGLNLRDDAQQVEAGRQNFHIIQILPTNRDFLDPETFLGRTLRRVKFDVTTITNNV